jgi:hypothetical protein
MSALVCPRCDYRFSRRRDLNRHLSRVNCTSAHRRTVDAAPLLERLEGISGSEAARLCGVSQSSVEYWRATRRISPTKLAEALERLDQAGDDLPIKAPKDDRVEVFYEWIGVEGWRVDAYTFGTIKPAGNSEAIDKLRFSLAEHVHRWARETFGDRLVSCTRNPADRSLI